MFLPPLRIVSSALFGVLVVAAVACASGQSVGDETTTTFTPSAGGASGKGGGDPVGETGGFPDGGAFPDGSAFPDGGSAGTGTTAGAGGTGTAGTGTSGSGTSGSGTAGSGTSGSGTSGSGTGACAGKPDGTVCATSTDPCKTPAVCVSGTCGGLGSQPDGTLCGTTNDACMLDATCKAGTCSGFKAKPDGTSCGKSSNPCVGDSTCKSGTCAAGAKQPDSYNWEPGNTWARCCGGQAVHTTSDSNCGGCGIVCNPGNGESCESRTNLGHTQYYCAGCVASAKCWSGCCSLSNPATMNVCSASDCKGGCGSLCPSGMHCVAGAPYMMSNWCEY